MPTDQLEQGMIVHLRTRRWVVQSVDKSRGGTIVSVACAEDDGQGEELQVVIRYDSRRFRQDRGAAANKF